MNESKCNCPDRCTVFSLAASVIIGVIAAFLRITAVITVSDAFLWVLFGIGIVYLALLFAIPRRGCCKRLTVLLSAILGTVLLSVILLGIEFAATSVAGAIAVGLLLFFFALTVSTAACYAGCHCLCGEQ